MTTMTAPERSLDQRMAALARANDIRSRRGKLKRQLKEAGQEKALLMAAMVMVDPPWWAATLKLYDLLMAIPKFGKVKAGKYLSCERISHSKTLAGLSPRQRKAMDDRLTGGEGE